MGSHCIVNTNFSADHEYIINCFLHVLHYATICGDLLIEEETQIGADATLVTKFVNGK